MWKIETELNNIENNLKSNNKLDEDLLGRIEYLKELAPKLAEDEEVNKVLESLKNFPIDWSNNEKLKKLTTAKNLLEEYINKKNITINQTINEISVFTFDDYPSSNWNSNDIQQDWDIAPVILVNSPEEQKKVDELKKLHDDIIKISINWSDTLENIKEKINKFRWKLDELDLSEEQKDDIINSLNKSYEDIKETKKDWYTEIQKYFDWLANNIQENNWEFIVNFWLGHSKKFNTKKEALEFIKEAKKLAEKNFESLFTRYALEAISLIWEWEKSLWNIPNSLMVMAWDFFDSNNKILTWLWTVLIWTLSLAIYWWIWLIHTAAFESTARRLILDPLKKFTWRWQLEDFSGKTVSAIDMGTQEGKDYMEFQQRQNIMEILRNDLEGYSGNPEYSKRKKVLDKIESFKLNRSPTFFYLTYKYIAGKWIGESLFSFFFRWWYFYIFKYENSKELTDKIMKQLNYSSYLTDGVRLFYNNAEVVREDGKLEVKLKNDGKKNSNFDNIINYVRSLNIPISKKNKIISDLEDFVNSIKTTPKSDSFIKKKIYFIINHNDYLSSEDIIRKIDSEINNIELQHTNITNRINAKIWRSELYRLYKFKELARNWSWLWNASDLDQAIKKIKDWKPIRENYSIKYWNINFSGNFNSLIEKWESAAKETKNGILLGGEKNLEEIKKNWPELTKNIYDYIKYWISDNEVERFANKEMDELIEKLSSSELIYLDENKLLNEVKLITEWKLPNYKIIEILSNVIKNETDVSKIEEILKYAEKWELILTEENLKEIVSDPSKFNNNYKKEIEQSDIDDFKKSIEVYANWSLEDFKNSYLGNETLREKYEKELKYIKILDVLDGSDRLTKVTEALNEFSEQLVKNSYSTGQWDWIIREIFAWNGFPNTINTRKRPVNNEFYDWRDKKTEIETIFKSLDAKTKAEKISKLKEQNLFDLFKEFDFYKDYEKQEETEKRSKQETLEGLKEKIQKIDKNINKKGKLKEKIKEYVKNNKEHLKTESDLIQFINELWNKWLSPFWLLTNDWKELALNPFTNKKIELSDVENRVEETIFILEKDINDLNAQKKDHIEDLFKAEYIPKNHPGKNFAQFYRDNVIKNWQTWHDFSIDSLDPNLKLSEDQKKLLADYAAIEIDEINEIEGLFMSRDIKLKLMSITDLIERRKIVDDYLNEVKRDPSEEKKARKEFEEKVVEIYNKLPKR